MIAIMFCIVSLFKATSVITVIFSPFYVFSAILVNKDDHKTGQ